MRSFQEKKSWKRILQSKFALTLLGALVIFFAWSVAGLWGKMEETRKNRSITEDRVEELEDKREKLRADIEKLESQKGIEESLRAQFGLAKEGEGLIVVVEEENKEENEKQKRGGFFGWFLDLFRRD